MKNLSQAPRDRILWALVTSNGKADRSTLRRRLHMRLAELDPILAILEDEKKICRTELRQAKGGPKHMIRLINDMDENYFGQHDELGNGREAQDQVPLITSRSGQSFGPTAFLQNATELFPLGRA